MREKVVNNGEMNMQDDEIIDCNVDSFIYNLGGCSISHNLTKLDKLKLFKKITGYDIRNYEDYIYDVCVHKKDIKSYDYIGIKKHIEQQHSIIGYDYVHKCVDGTPDHRYKNNKCPMYKYSSIIIIQIFLRTGYIIQLIITDTFNGNKLFDDLDKHMKQMKLI